MQSAPVGGQYYLPTEDQRATFSSDSPIFKIGFKDIWIDLNVLAGSWIWSLYIGDNG